eukprot:1152054-Pelagomonas_calceolata.AAC.5
MKCQGKTWHLVLIHMDIRWRAHNLNQAAKPISCKGVQIYTWYGGCKTVELLKPSSRSSLCGRETHACWTGSQCQATHNSNPIATLFDAEMKVVGSYNRSCHPFIPFMESPIPIQKVCKDVRAQENTRVLWSVTFVQAAQPQALAKMLKQITT